MAAVLLAPVLVQPQGLEFEENEWVGSGPKRDTVAKSKTVPSAVIEDRSSERALGLLNDGADSATAATLAAGSSEGEGSPWMWAILASLCVAGVGLAGFSYFRSNGRHATSW